MERFLLPSVAIDKPLEKLFTARRLCSPRWIILTTSMHFFTWMKRAGLCVPVMFPSQCLCGPRGHEVVGKGSLINHTSIIFSSGRYLLCASLARKPSSALSLLSAYYVSVCTGPWPDCSGECLLCCTTGGWKEVTRKRKSRTTNGGRREQPLLICCVGYALLMAPCSSMPSRNGCGF